MRGRGPQEWTGYMVQQLVGEGGGEVWSRKLQVVVGVTGSACIEEEGREKNPGGSEVRLM